MGQEPKTSETRSRRSFSEEFKRDAVNLVAVEGYSFKRAAWQPVQQVVILRSVRPRV